MSQAIVGVPGTILVLYIVRVFVSSEDVKVCPPPRRDHLPRTSSTIASTVGQHGPFHKALLVLVLCTTSLFSLSDSCWFVVEAFGSSGVVVQRLEKPLPATGPYRVA